jgi:hypothetical protein
LHVKNIKEHPMEPMTTLSEVIIKLRDEGYTEDFNLQPHCITCVGNDLRLHPEDFVVDRHYRFEGPSDPNDEAILYAISSTKGDLKGILVNNYGASSDDATDAMVRKFKERYDTY